MAKASSGVSADDIISAIKKQNIAAVYVLHGEEPYYIDVVSNYIENHLLSEMEKAFNQTIFYGKDADIDNVLNAARRYPMMAERQLVMLKEAQEFKKLDELTSYLEKPMPTTVLVICHKYKKIDSRLKFMKKVKEKAVVFESNSIPDYHITAWVEKYCKENKISIQTKAVSMLVELLGNDLSKIANEIDKLLINIKDKQEISADHVEQYVGVSREFNLFEFQKAVGEGNFFKAQKIIQYFGANPKDASIIPVLAILYGFFSKLLMIHQGRDYSERGIAAAAGINPYIAKEYVLYCRNYPADKCLRIINYLHEFDMKAKGMGMRDVPDASLMREMTFKIMKV